MDLKYNIPLYYWFNFFRQAFFFAPVLVLFFYANHLSMTQILLLQSIYSIVVVLLEIPTGAIGDYFGKKTSIVIGAFIFFLGFSIYSLGTTFAIFLIAEITAGIGSSLISGSDSALIYGSLKKLGKEKFYKKVEGNANALLLTGFLIAGLIGGYIGKYSLRLTMVCSAIFAFIAFSISLFFKEPKIKIEKRRESYSNLIINSLKIIRKNKTILWYSIYSAVLTSLAYVISWYYQPVFIQLNINIIYFGWLYAIFGVVAILSSKYAHKISDFFGNKGTIILLGMLIILPSILLGTIASIVTISVFILHQMYMGMSKVIFNNKILSLIPSSKSATIISINNMGNRLLFAIISPIFGYIMDIYSLKVAMLAMGLTAVILSSILLIVYFIALRKESN